MQALLRSLDGRQVLPLLVAKPLLLESRADAGPKHGGIEWLRQIILRAAFDAANDAVQFIERRDHDHRQIVERRVELDLDERFVATELGHDHVEQHEVVAAAAQL